jgi:hypothetical protein
VVATSSLLRAYIVGLIVFFTAFGIVLMASGFIYGILVVLFGLAYAALWYHNTKKRDRISAEAAEKYKNDPGMAKPWEK